MGLIRIFLALVVAIGHFNSTILQPLDMPRVGNIVLLGMNAGFAVTFFFMISGFLISFVLSRKYEDSKSGTLQFYQSRFIRIFSLYWPVLALVSLIPAVQASWANHPWIDRVFFITLLGQDWRMILPNWPGVYDASLSYLQQAWTLAPELTFYLLAPLILRRPWLALTILAASLSVRGYYHLSRPMTAFNAPEQYYFFGATVCFFLLGHFARVLGDQIALLRNGYVGMALIFVAVASLLSPNSGAGAYWDTWPFGIAVGAFALALPGVFHATKDIHWMNLLGDLSYGVYLIHIAPIHFLRDHGGLAGVPHTAFVSYGITIGMCLLVCLLAWAALYLIERPMADVMIRLLRA